MNTINKYSAKKVGRPINCFLAFRLDKYPEITSQYPGINHREISKIIAKWWKDASESEKAPYRAIADKAKADHAKMHPNYKYQPVKRSERNVRPYRRREVATVFDQKTNSKKHLLKRWLVVDDDCKSETSSNSSGSACSMDPQPHHFDMPIKLEPSLLEDSYFFAPSIYHQPGLKDNLIYDDIKFSDTIPDCAFSSTHFSHVNNMITEFAPLDYFETPNYVNLQMLSMDNSAFMP